ncbi:MAG TPA: universal stress protein [Kofleriaceae bacterium]|jgi:nucleotide-binding universal stress UspA family protein|nr:universal stress protein [Kofleriaceae bacterium]
MAIRKIIVGVDFTPGSELAAHRAAELAAQVGAELVLVHAATIPEHPAVPDSIRPAADRMIQVLQDRLADDRRGLADLRERLTSEGITVSQLIVDRFPDDALVEAASELHADLVVTGSRHRTGLRRWLLGSVAEHVVRAAPVPVLVALPGDPDRGFERIVVGTDFSEPSTHALAQAVELARPGAVIDLVHCFQMSLLAPDVVPGLGTVYQEVLDTLTKDAHDKAAAQMAAHAGAPVTIRFTFVEAPPREGLCDFAEHHQADLLAVASHGRRGVRRLILGSVAEATVRHAPCSVLVVR